MKPNWWLSPIFAALCKMTIFHFFIVLKLSHECSLPTFFSIFFFFYSNWTLFFGGGGVFLLFVFCLFFWLFYFFVVAFFFPSKSFPAVISKFLSSQIPFSSGSPSACWTEALSKNSELRLSSGMPLLVPSSPFRTKTCFCYPSSESAMWDKN